MVDIDAMSADDTLAHVWLVRHQRHELRMWELRVADFPQSDVEGRRATLNIVDSIKPRDQRERSIYAVAKGWDRVRIIGQTLEQHGDEWAEDHPQWMAWLKQNGITPQRSIESWRKIHKRHQSLSWGVGFGESID